MVIHIHQSHNPVSGEMKRIINIDRDVAGFPEGEVIEVEFFSIRYWRYVLRRGRFVLSDKVIKKLYIPDIPRFGILNDWFRSICILTICLFHNPQFIIEEWSLPRGVGMIAYIKKHLIIGLDIHGAAPEEYYYLNHTESKRLIRQERYSVRHAHFIICQSEEMKRLLHAKYGVADKVVVYRCGVDTRVFFLDDSVRSEMRASLSIPEQDLVFVYSGGMHPWQKFSDAVRLFDAYFHYNNQSWFLVLTKDVDICERMLEELGVEDCRESILIRSLSYDEVPRFLNSADVAFLLRDDHIMNAVAFPTKLAEYFACGLPIISTPVSLKWVGEEGKMFFIDSSSIDVSMLETQIHRFNKADIASFAKNELSLEKDRAIIRSLFSIG